MSRALYRKYRPTSFDEIVGQSHITDILRAAVKSGTISHAYLFTGQRGTGKTSIGRILAHTINELPYSDQQHLDIIEIDAASNRRIDDIRDLREKVHIAPSSARYKVYIIDEVHMLTTESFNALLKTIEEPPAHVVFILATTEVHKVPATIISRTQRFHFRPVALDQVAEHLGTIATKEGIATTPDALKLIAEHGEGSFRDSISLLDQLAGSGQEINAEMVEAALGLAPTEQISKLITATLSHDSEAAVRDLRQLYAAGVTATVVTSQLLRKLAGESTPGAIALIDALLDVPQSFDPRLKLLTVIARASQPSGGHKTVALEATAPTTAVAEREVMPAAAPVKPKPATTTPEPPAKPAAPAEPPEPATKKAATGKFDWQVVLDTLQSREPALFSVLKRADASLENNTLTLRFAYSLHRKKLENSKYRIQLLSLVENLFGITPELVAESGAPAAPSDPAAAAVAELMGGGEQVNV